MAPTSIGRHYDYEDVDQRLRYAAVPADSVQRAVFFLSDDDTAWNPDSAKSHIAGPGRLEYVRQSDGNVDIVFIRHRASRVRPY